MLLASSPDLFILFKDQPQALVQHVACRCVLTSRKKALHHDKAYMVLSCAVISLHWARRWVLSLHDNYQSLVIWEMFFFNNLFSCVSKYTGRQTVFFHQILAFEMAPLTGRRLECMFWAAVIELARVVSTVACCQTLFLGFFALSCVVLSKIS